MQEPPEDARIRAASRLIDRRRYREALDLLNDAIRLNPRKTDSFHLRSRVFEALGLYPQAEADRQRAGELEELQPTADAAAFDVGEESPEETRADEGHVVGDAEEIAAAAALAEDGLDEDAAQVDAAAEPEEVPEPIAADATEQPEDVEFEGASRDGEGMMPGETVGEEPAPRIVPVPRYARPSGSSGGGGSFGRSVGTVMLVLGLIAAFGVGIYIAFSSVSDALDGGDDGESTAASPTPADDLTPTPTATFDAPEDALSGSPLDFDALAGGWKSKEITSTPHGVNTDVNGFAPTPTNVTLSRAGEEMEVAVLLYPNAQAISQDWTLGNKPTPKEGRSVPSGSVVWYNLNAVTIVLESNDALRQDALDGFLFVNP